MVAINYVYGCQCWLCHHSDNNRFVTFIDHMTGEKYAMVWCDLNKCWQWPTATCPEAKFVKVV